MLKLLGYAAALTVGFVAALVVTLVYLLNVSGEAQ